MDNTPMINSFNSDNSNITNIKGTPLILRQSLASESPLKMMKDAFYFILKALFVLKIFKFLS